ncbi:MAG: GAF domain-containing protein [Calditrichia bacterium]|jgi:K+-sensing histidine kinase KdpD|nr:GAF domain-containing protein [Calditrichia bacterium]
MKPQRPQRKSTKKSNSSTELQDLKNQLKRKINEMHSMQQIGKTLSSVLDRDRLLVLIMDEVTRLMDAERGTLYIVEGEKGELWSKIAQKSEIKEIRLKIGVGIAGHVAKTGEIINIKDAYNDERFDPTTDKKTGYRTRSILCMPIREPVKKKGQVGEIIGVLQILNRKEGVFTAEDEDLLTSLCSQVAISLVNARLYGILDNRARELDLLFNLEKELSRAYDVNEMSKNLVKLIPKSLDSEHLILLFLDDEGKAISYQFANQVKEDKLKTAPFSVEKGILNYVLDKKEIYLTNDAPNDKYIDQELMKFLKLEVQNVICAPLINEKGVIGVFYLINKKGEHGYYTSNDKKILESISSQIARGVENYRLKEEKMKADRLSAIGNMMSTIVHDLRTPMNNIYGFVDLMLEEDEQETREEYAGIINEQIKILTNMTTDVLDFAKGKTTILPVKYPVDKLVKDFAKFFKDDTKRKGFNFEWAVNVSSMIYIDPEKINRVFMNIMKNSLEAMKKGGTFSLTAEEQNGEILFSLKDTGKGIPEEIRDKLFDSFVTSGKKGGTGLGLAIVKKVVEEHKGKIEVESEPGVGTTFKLYFPKV